MTLEELKNNINTNLPKGLPGKDAQFIMAPVNPDRLLDVPKDHRKAGVVALMYPIDEEMHIVFIIRSSKDTRDKHAGQVGFPGGKWEEIDENMLATALREVEEEIGVPKHDIEIITPLTTLYVIPSNFLVSPYLAMVKERPNFIIQESEVDNVIEIPLRLFKEDIKKNKVIKTSYQDKDVPYYDLKGKTLWGATAMIMSEIEHLIFN